MSDFERIKEICSACRRRMPYYCPASCIFVCTGCRYTTELTLIAGNSEELYLFDCDSLTVIKDKSLDHKTDRRCKTCASCQWCQELFERGMENVMP